MVEVEGRIPRPPILPFGSGVLCDGNLPKMFSSFQEINGSWKWVEIEVGGLCVPSKNLWKVKMKTLDIHKRDRTSDFLLACPTQLTIRRNGRDSRGTTLQKWRGILGRKSHILLQKQNHFGL